MKSGNLYSAFVGSLICISLLLTGCGQLSTLQTAKTLAPGEATLGAAAFGYGINDGNSNGGGNIGNGLFPHVEFLGRYGIAESFDMGVKLSTAGNLLVDGKYQLVGDPESAFALGIGGGFEYQGTNPTENIVFRTHLPLYASYHPSEAAAIYLAPRWVYQYVSDGDNSYFLGGGLGYSHRFSGKFTGVAEGSFFLPRTQNANNNGTYLFQFGVGAIFHLGRKDN